MLGDLPEKHPDLKLLSADEPADLVARANECDGVIGLGGAAVADMARAGTRLRWIQLWSAGVERYVSVPEIRDSEIVLTNAQIIQGPEIADHAFALLLALTACGPGTPEDPPAPPDVYDTRGATQAISGFVDDLSQWWLRRSRRRLSRGDDATDQHAAFGTMHLALMAVARTIAPLLPFLAEEFHRVLVASTDEVAPESVHLTAWPTADLTPLRDEALEAAMADQVIAMSLSLKGAREMKRIRPDWKVCPYCGTAISG